jgi:hypothetical protein
MADAIKQRTEAHPFGVDDTKAPRLLGNCR